MPGTNAANRVRQNHQLNRRIRTSGGRKRINKSRYEERAPLIVNSHQKRMLKSNPQANITLSKKKLRQLTRAVNIERKRLEEKGVVFMDEEEEDEQQLINQVKPSKKSTVAVAPEESMEITGSGQGTVLGAPMQ